MIKKVYFSNSGVPATGLTLTWNGLKKVSDGTDYAQPGFTEIGKGWYKFTINPTEPLVGVIDGSATLTSAPERYVPVYIDQNDYLYELNVIPCYDSNSDAITYEAFLLVNGVIATNANLTSCSLSVYDKLNNLLFTVSSVTAVNGIFVLTKSSPGLVQNTPYYVKGSIVYAGDTYISLDTYFSLQ